MYMLSALRTWKKASYPLEMELQTVVSLHVGARTQNLVLWRAAIDVKCWDTRYYSNDNMAFVSSVETYIICSSFEEMKGGFKSLVITSMQALLLQLSHLSIHPFSRMHPLHYLVHTESVSLYERYS